MNKRSPVFTWTQVSEQGSPCGPRSRQKHAVCHHRGYVYLFGGKQGHVPLKDLWRYDLASGRWEQVKDSGDKPPSLQGHTIVGYKDDLYVFGGQFCFAGSAETPLWIFNIPTSTWRKYQANPDGQQVASPCSRRGHTMVQYAGCLYVYGGYIDVRGSSSQLWTYDIGSNSWQLLYSSSQQHNNGPGIRHNHTCVVYDKAMWMYGGMADLQVKSDMWKWHFDVGQWQKVKLKFPCPELSEHSAVHVNGHMIVYGGIKKSSPCSDVWSFRFGTSTWQKMQTFCKGNKSPVARSQHCSIIIDPLQLDFSTAAQPRGYKRGFSVPEITKNTLESLKDEENAQSFNITTHYDEENDQAVPFSKQIKSIPMIKQNKSKFRPGIWKRCASVENLSLRNSRTSFTGQLSAFIFEKPQEISKFSIDEELNINLSDFDRPESLTDNPSMDKHLESGRSFEGVASSDISVNQNSNMATNKEINYTEKGNDINETTSTNNDSATYFNEDDTINTNLDGASNINDVHATYIIQEDDTRHINDFNICVDNNNVKSICEHTLANTLQSDTDSILNYTLQNSTDYTPRNSSCDFTGNFDSTSLMEFGTSDKNEMFSQQIPLIQNVNMLVFGGKEAHANNFTTKPLPVWRLDIKF